ncbi:DUF5959 family protein [Actinacidiphila glaucinigra]|uniref:DUF5959 family protein n=1 Tax=Actinacidiphila glaucinigra TaxID=235986 RepID=UPI003698F974
MDLVSLTEGESVLLVRVPGRHMPGVLPWHGFLDAAITMRSGFARSLEPCLDPDDLAPGPRPWRRRPPGRTPGGRTTGATLGSGSNTPGKAAPGSADAPAGLIQHSALGLRSDSWFIIRGGRVARRMQISGPHSEIPWPPDRSEQRMAARRRGRAPRGAADDGRARARRWRRLTRAPGARRTVAPRRSR